MEKYISKQLENWKFCRNLALDILQMLTDKQLQLTVGKNMGTLGEQFRHMIRVQMQYIEALETKKIAPTQQTIDPSVATSKDALIALWKTTNGTMQKTISSLNDEEVSSLKIDWTFWGIESMNLYGHLQALIDHQNLHNGQIIVYLRIHEIAFPDSWSAWGL